MSMPRLSMTWPLVAALAVGCAAALAAPDMATDRLTLAGGGDRLWLVRTGADEMSFDVLTYRAGEKWRWVQRGVGGRPTAAVADGEQLHVLTGPGPAYLVVYTDSSRSPAIGATPPRKIWPGEAAPLAACGAEALAGVDGWSLVVVVPGAPPEAPPAGDEPQIAPPADQPTATDADQGEAAPQPAISLQPPAEAPAAPAVLQFGDGNWRRLTDLPSAVLADRSSVRVSAANNVIYLLVTSVSGDNSLWRWPGDDDGPWTQLNLTGHATSSAVLAMFHSGPNELTLVLALPAGPDQDEQLELVSLDPSGAATAPQPITLSKGEPLTLPTRPLAAPLVVPEARHRVALLWRDDGSAKFTLCDVSTGVAEPARDVSALTEAPLDDSGRMVLNYFVIVLLVVTFAVMIAARPRTTPGPMILPPACRPAPLGKRVLAGMIDFVPISVIVSFVAPIGELPGGSPGGLWELWDQYNQVLQTRQAAFSVIATLCTYMVYGVVMEARFAATLGKMLLKMRIIAGDGRPPGLREAALRNVVKMLEISMPWLLVIVPLLNPARQRLGDILARTVVIEYTPSTGGPGGGPPPPTDDEPFGGREDDDPGGP